MNKPLPFSLRRSCFVVCWSLAVSGCHVDREAVYRQIFTCDTKAVDPGCGTDRNSGPMMCFAGSTLGGSDFCSERCGDGQTLTAADGALCSQSGARLPTCDLSPGAVGDCGNAALGCFRNNVFSDAGVCMTINPCTQDGDCRDPVRSVCATSFVKKIYDRPDNFKNDHLWCLQAGCQERRTACSPGESCLRDLIPAAAHPPDICVPNCDSNFRCPPAHFCYRQVSSKAAPNICIPGLLGFRCDKTIDCMMGECVDTGHGFNVCSTKCGNDADCSKYDGEQGRFLCNQDQHCMTPDAFRGSPCSVDLDCPSGLTCAFLSADNSGGNCLPPCDANTPCAARGGVPHTCLPRGDGKGNVCYPGYLGMPCKDDDSACLPGLSCRALGPDQPHICSSLCETDDDCDKGRWTVGSFCQPIASAVRVCLPAKGASQTCERDAQCQSKRCVARADGTKACTPPPGART